MYTGEHAERMKKHAGRKYQPSNGNEGDIFMTKYCYRCKHEKQDPITWEGGCRIIAMTMAFDTSDDEYPSEWIIATDGQPTCTAFEPENGE